MQSGDPLPPAFPNLYDALAAIVPGLSQVRGPAALYSGVHMSLSILAGFGAAAILRVVGERRLLPVALLGALAWINARKLETPDPVLFFERAGVGLSDGRHFQGEGFVRLNFGCRRETLLEALSRMKLAVMDSIA